MVLVSLSFGGLMPEGFVGGTCRRGRKIVMGSGSWSPKYNDEDEEKLREKELK